MVKVYVELFVNCISVLSKQLTFTGNTKSLHADPKKTCFTYVDI